MNKSNKRLFMFLAVLCFWMMTTTVALAQRYTVHYQDRTAEQVIKDLRQKTGYEFVYQKDILAGLPNVTVDLDNLNTDQLFNSIFRSHFGLDFEIKDKTVVLKKGDVRKEGHIHGRVKDDTGEPLAGAAVYIKETRQGGVTDKDGYFDLNVRYGNHIEVSYLGYTPKTMVYNGANNWNIILQPDENNTLEDVVVTGIFTKAKESYTGSVSTISAQQLQTYKGQNLLQTLKNLDVSMNFAIDNINGSNPNNLPNINIRGNSSLPTSVEEYNSSASNATNTPLVILDGFEISLTKLMDYNDDEIQSINIMKDASATAIYGSRGANGVIVVTTKKPEAGHLKINAEAGFQMEIPDLSSYDLLNAAEKLELEKQVGLYDASNLSSQRSYDEAYSEKLLSVLRGGQTDWLKIPSHVGVGQLYKLRLEGGSDEFRWGTSISWNDINGAMKNSNRKTFNGSVTLMYNKKNVAIRNYTSFGVNRSSESNYGEFSTYAEAEPYDVPYDSEGNLVHYLPNFYRSTNNVQNPLYDASLNQFDKSGYTDVSNNLAVDWTIIDGLIFRAQFGISSTNNHSDVFIPAEHSTFVDYTSDEDFLRRGRYTKGTGKTDQYDGNFTLSYNKVLKDKHQVYVGLNYEIASTKSEMYYFVAEGFSSEDMTKIFNARQYYQNSAPTGYSNLSHRIGFTGNANYTYDNRYYLDLSYRIDGSSEYGTDKKYAPFYSAGIGWNLHNKVS